MNSLSGEGNISPRGACLKGVSLVGSYFDGTRPSFSEEWHRLNGEEGNVVSVTPLRPRLRPPSSQVLRENLHFSKYNKVVNFIHRRLNSFVIGVAGGSGGRDVSSGVALTFNCCRLLMLSLSPLRLT